MKEPLDYFGLMKFIFSKHAKKRMKQRRLGKPTRKNVLRRIGKRLMKRLGYRFKIKSGKEYFLDEHDTIYACVELDAGNYLVITAFKLEDETKKKGA